MAVVTTDFLINLLRNFRALFAQEFDAAQAMQGWREVSMSFNSQGESESYNWLGTVPAMEDVTHQSLKLEDLESFNFTITNLIYKSGFEVQRAAIEDDKLNLITPRVRQLADEAARHPGQLLLDLFETPGNAFDGVAFFANTRAIGASANIDNILTGTGTTVAQIQADLQAARAAMRLFQDDKGRVMGLIGNVIVVPPDIEQLMYQALNANQGTINLPVVPATVDGVIRQAGYMVIVNHQLTDVNDWYLLHVRPAVRPFIYQTRVAPALEGLTNPLTEAGIIRDRFLYSVRARYAVGVGDPRHVIRNTNT